MRFTVADLLKNIGDVSARAAIDLMAKKDAATWAIYNRRLKGSPYAFDVSAALAKAEPGAFSTKQLLLRHRPFLLKPMGDLHPHKVYKKGRQVGVSELSVTEVLWFLDSHPNTKWVYCVPDDAEILTRRGWLRYNEVRADDEGLVLDPKTHVSRWEPIHEVRAFMWEGTLNAVGPFHCTDEHRWPIQTRYGASRFVVPTSSLKSHYHKIPRLAPHEHDGAPSLLSPRLAAILGWVVTDGHQWMTGTKPNLNTVMMCVYQSERKYLKDIEKLLKAKRRNRREQVNGNHCWTVTVQREDVNAILASGYRTKGDLPSIVSRLSPQAARAMRQAMFDAEGCASGPRGSSRFFAQNHGPVLDAFQILCTLTGAYANIGERGAYVVEADTQKAWLKPAGWKTEPRPYRGIVWCPRTPSGTWFMRYQGKVTFTGNTFPRDKQLTDFSTTRIGETMDESPRMKHLFGVPNQIYTKRVGASSFLLLRSAWESNLGEGIDADGVTLDEKDRMKEGIDIAFRESLASSKYGLLREVSTPSLPGRGVDAPYLQSDQQEWHVRCAKCGMWQTVDYPDNIIQMMDIPVGTTELPAGAYEYRCKKEKCRGELDRIKGQWVAKYPTRTNVRGYWIPQTICPWISATQVMQKLIEYKFRQLWENYVLGRTSMGENMLLSPADFEESIAGHEMCFTRTSDWERIVVGVDWGNLNWVLVLGENAFNHKLYLLNIGIFEDSKVNELESVKQVAEFIAPFDPDMVVCDAGYGKDRNLYLLKKYPGKLFACWYNPSDKGSRTFTPSWSEAFNKVLVDRTMTIKNTCRSIKEHEIGLPVYDHKVALLIKHFLNLAPMRVEEEGEIYEVIEHTGDDHLVHCMGYCLIAFDKLLAGVSNFSFGFT